MVVRIFVGVCGCGYWLILRERLTWRSGQVLSVEVFILFNVKSIPGTNVASLACIRIANVFNSYDVNRDLLIYIGVLNGDNRIWL